MCAAVGGPVGDDVLDRSWRLSIGSRAPLSGDACSAATVDRSSGGRIHVGIGRRMPVFHRVTETIVSG